MAKSKVPVKKAATKKAPTKKKAPKKKVEDKEETGIEKKEYNPDLSLEENGIMPMDGKEPMAKERRSVFEAKTVMDSARWNLSEALFEIHESGAYGTWGYPSWDSYVENEVGMTMRTAQYLTAMYHYFQRDLIGDVSALDPDDPERVKAIKERDEIIAEVKKLGWTKGKSLIGVLDRSNSKEWIEKAQELSSTELESAVKNELNRKKAIKEGKDPDEPVEVMKAISFKVSEEQLEIVENAMQLAETKLDSTRRGHQISMICQDFVATNMGQGEEGHKRFGSYLNKIGAMFGVRIIAVDKETHKVTHNQELFDDLSKDSE